MLWKTNEMKGFTPYVLKKLRPYFKNVINNCPYIYLKKNCPYVVICIIKIREKTDA